MKKIKYPVFENYDFSEYKEVTGNDLYKINGGWFFKKKDESSDKGISSETKTSEERGSPNTDSTSKTPVTGTPANTATQTVKTGDTLSQIVEEYNKKNGTNLTVADVAEQSGIDNPDLIYPGQVIIFGNTSQGNTETNNNIPITGNSSSYAPYTETSDYTDPYQFEEEGAVEIEPQSATQIEKKLFLKKLKLDDRQFWNLAVGKSMDEMIRAIYTKAGVDTRLENGQLNAYVDFGIADFSFKTPKFELLKDRFNINMEGSLSSFTGQACVGIKNCGIGVDTDISMLKFSGGVNFQMSNITLKVGGDIIIGGVGAGESMLLGKSHKLVAGVGGGWRVGWEIE